MKRKRLSSLIVVFVSVLMVSFGFFMLFGEEPTTAVSFSSINSVQPAPTDNLLGSWTQGANITSPGSNGGAGVGYSRNDTCWLFALNGDVDGSGTAPGQLRRYNITTNTWANMSTNTGRAWTSMTKAGPVSNTILYDVGGMPSGASSWTQMTGTMQAYSINNNTWTTLTAAPIPTGSTGLSSYQDSLLYAVGGMGTSGSPMTNVQLYNISSGTWRAATPLPSARANGWMVIKSDTIYYGCGAGPTTSTFNNTIFVGLISQSDRSQITWSTSALTYPVSQHRCDAADLGCFGMIIGPGGSAWWGMGNTCYTWKGGNSPFVSVGPVITTSDAMVGSGSYTSGSYEVYKFVIASGLILAAPYHILNTQIYTDSCVGTAPPTGWCEGFTSATFPPTGWTLTGSANLWSRHTVSGYGNGVGSAQANFYGISTGTQQLNTLTFPATTYATDSLIFQDAYATYISENDQLQVMTSSNGGSTWTQLVMLNGGISGQLVTAPPQTSEFVPTSSQWKYQRFALPIGTNRIGFNAITAYGNQLYIDSICVKLNPTGIPINVGVPKDFSLSQNYPNPFNPSTKIQYAIPRAGDVRMVVYDILGREVATLVNEFKNAGVFTVEFNASSLASGVYFYKIQSGTFTDTKKMLLVK